MLTSVLASSHAAKFGARAGLGFTLVQYGFYLRNREPELAVAEGFTWGPATDDGAPRPTFDIADDADKYVASKAFASVVPTDIPSLSTGDYAMPSDVTAAADWLSFFLMTLGWLLFLASVLGYWRVKRYERSLIQSAAPATTDGGVFRATSHAEVGLPMPIRTLFAGHVVSPEPFTPNSLLDHSARQRRIQEFLEQDARSV